jgi:hypothetical protein
LKLNGPVFRPAGSHVSPARDDVSPLHTTERD